MTTKKQDVKRMVKRRSAASGRISDSITIGERTMETQQLVKSAMALLLTIILVVGLMPAIQPSCSAYGSNLDGKSSVIDEGYNPLADGDAEEEILDGDVIEDELMTVGETEPSDDGLPADENAGAPEDPANETDGVIPPADETEDGDVDAADPEGPAEETPAEPENTMILTSSDADKPILVVPVGMTATMDDAILKYTDGSHTLVIDGVFDGDISIMGGTVEITVSGILKGGITATGGTVNLAGAGTVEGECNLAGASKVTFERTKALTAVAVTPDAPGEEPVVSEEPSEGVGEGAPEAETALMNVEPAYELVTASTERTSYDAEGIYFNGLHFMNAPYTMTNSNRQSVFAFSETSAVEAIVVNGVEDPVELDLNFDKCGTSDNPVLLTVIGNNDRDNGASLKGDIVMRNQSSVKVDGTGVIRGTGTESVIYVVDSNLTIAGDVVITGGRGTKQEYNEDCNFARNMAVSTDATFGGGIFVTKTADAAKVQKGNFVTSSLLIDGGIIYGNHATCGGGIFVDSTCDFIMAGGIVDSNAADQGDNEHEGSSLEGGGIFLNGSTNAPLKDGYDPAVTKILGGTITNNKTMTTKDWGGGGIFVQAQRKLVFPEGTTIAVTENTARGLGGGISGCPHAQVGVGGFGEIKNSMVIYNNTALMENHPNSANLWCLNTQKSTDYKFLGDYLLDWEHDESCTHYSSADPNKFGTKDETVSYGYKLTGIERNGEIVNPASDYYCVNGSILYGQRFTPGDKGIAWKGVVVKPAGQSGKKDYAVGTVEEIAKGDMRVYQGCTVGMTYVGEVPADAKNRSVIISGNFSNTHGGGIGCNGKVEMGDMPSSKDHLYLWAITVGKELLDCAGQNSIADETFSFTLSQVFNDGKEESIQTATNDANGNVSFVFGSEYADKYIATGDGYTFVIREVTDESHPGVIFDEKAIYADVKLKETSKTYETSGFGTIYENKIDLDTVEFYTLNDDGSKDILDSKATFTNSYEFTGTSWAPTVQKYYQTAYNLGEANHPVFDFTLTEIDSPEAVNDTVTHRDIALLPASDDADEEAVEPDNDGADDAESDDEADWEADGTDEAVEAPDMFDGDDAGMAQDSVVTFRTVGDSWKAVADMVASPVALAFNEGIPTYDNADENDTTHWYVLTEDTAQDPRAFIFKVDVKFTGTPATTLSAETTAVYVAESWETRDGHIAVTNPVELDDPHAIPAFVNTDEALEEFELGSYAVHAATGMPLLSDQRCLVDPKIIKELEGRALKDGEFTFQLVEANGDYSVAAGGQVISTASNDQYGMVDFDKAANVAGTDEDPCCLLFTQPGTYRYRVIEAPGVERDPSIAYSDQVITFTAVVEGGDGEPLICTDMYYGMLDENGENVRFEEDALVWHPTMTNTAKGQELKVRKIDAENPDEGLEGATYGLYMVNDGAQDDILVGTATSDSDGWMTFEDVSLSETATYYFKEIAPPSGYTVDAYRSEYFTIATGADGEYVLRYLVETQPVPLEDVEEGESYGDMLATPAVRKDDGTLQFVYDLNGGVADGQTDVDFAKRDTMTNDWVEGAELAIIEKESGTTIASWVTGADVHNLDAGTLIVDTVYILRELSAPQGYNKAADVEFHLDAYGALVIDSGAMLDGLRNAEATNDTTLTLYDKVPDGEEVDTQYRENTTYNSETKLVKTGDNLPLVTLAGVALLSLIVAAVTLIRRRRAERL